MTENNLTVLSDLLARNAELETKVLKLQQALARRQSESTVELDKAMYKFHQQLLQPEMTGKNPFLGNKYATLSDIDKSLRKAFEGTGLSYSQDACTNVERGTVSVTTTIHHESGEYRSYGPFELKPAKADVQGYGGAVTYAKRYQVSAVFGIVADPDDDGESAMDRGQTTKAPKRVASKQAKEAPKKDKQEIIKEKLLEKVGGLGANEELIKAWQGLPAEKAIADMTQWHNNRQAQQTELAF
ncbi:ERF family protein [Streptococcus sciuri]|uniref:ERF family protein n=1 Tax=Streptococcus sciuri TaxID=2973939 RepID=A0ABT2F876_9STRE|nr:ERF family protein [Streptococcus sciuri]MCS4488398.1 ERF family protein [Streptococcus sciuri]